MEKDIILSPIHLHDLVNLIATKVLDKINSQQEEKDLKKLLSVSESCQIFKPGISRQTLAKWTAEGLLEKRVVGKRVFYKLEDLLAAGKTLQRYKRIES